MKAHFPDFLIRGFSLYRLTHEFLLLQLIPLAAIGFSITRAGMP